MLQPFIRSMAALLLLPLVSLPALVSAFTSSSGFILVEADDRLRYPLFGLFPLPLDLPSQAAIVATLLGAAGIAFVLLAYSDGEWLSPQEIIYRIEGLVQAITDSPSNFLAGAMATLTSAVGLGGDVASRLSQLVIDRSSRSNGAGPTSDTAQRTKKRSSLLRRAHVLSAASASNNAAVDSLSVPLHYPGLYNTGNTCFFNSVVQSLASTEALRRYLEGIVALAERWDVATPVTDALLELLTGTYFPLLRMLHQSSVC